MAEPMPVSPDGGAGGNWLSAPASRVDGRPGMAGLHPAACRASRGPLNEFAGALAGVLRYLVGGGRRRCPDTAPAGLSDACLGVEPAYPPWPRFARPRRELAGAVPPQTPHRQRRVMSAGRAVWVKIRSSEAERAAWHAKARSAGLTLSDLVRRSVGRVHTWTVAHADVERERTQQVARIGNNLNQIARWANTHNGGHRGRRGDRPPDRHRAFARDARSVREPGLRC